MLLKQSREGLGGGGRGFGWGGVRLVGGRGRMGRSMEGSRFGWIAETGEGREWR